jgi:phytanoyl-CoA hydroxylase
MISMISAYKMFFEENGYAVVPGLFSTEEASQYSAHFMKLRDSGPKPGDMVADTQRFQDPLKRYPRMIHMHRWDETTLAWLLDERIERCLKEFLEDEPLAVQTMLYFKPAGARGQALHQDNFYLKAHPGTCMAAWMALDRCDEENGCMRVVPGSHRWPILCTEKADTQASFTDITVPLPPGMEAVPVVMEPGDVLFFNGSLVHGSYPNTSKDRFRRSLIGHYIEAKAEQVSKFDQPVLRMDGSEFELSDAADGGPCGTFVETDGAGSFQMIGRELAGAAHE